MFDPSSDLTEVVDHTEPVMLLRRGSYPGGPGTPIAHAFRSAVTTGEVLAYNRSGVRREMSADGQCVSNDVAWHLPVAELPAAPRLGDAILDAAGRRWTILVVKQATLGTRWRCIARDVLVAYRLNDTISIQKCAAVKGDSGEAAPVWRTWRTGVRARIQPAETTVELSNQLRRAVRKYRVFLAEDSPIDQTHRIVGPDGAAYRILSSLGEERIGEMQILEVEAIE